MSALTQKKKIREQMRKGRESLDVSEVATASRAILGRLREQPFYEQAQTVCLYYAVGKEVCLHTLLDHDKARGKETLLPAYDAPSQHYRFKAWVSHHDVRPGPHGIPEPVSGPFVRPTGDVCAVVPGLAFDDHGGRLGYGAGFYDRLLAECARGSRMTAVGVCFDFQLQARLPQETWDYAVDWVVTEKRLIDCNVVKTTMAAMK